MPRRASTKLPPFDQADPFTRQVEEALRHIHDMQWLGTRSPLSTPYLLGAYLHPHLSSVSLKPEQRGAALRDLLDEALETLDVSFRRHIILRYFETKSRDDILDEIAMSVNTLMRHQRKAVQHFRDAVLHLMRPALRAETPRRFATLIGRADVYTKCMKALNKSQTVTITGLSGIGKTTLAAFLVQDLGDAPVCWITLRPGINDSLEGVAFAIGYAFDQHGVGHLWRQLIATGGTGESPEALLAVLRHDLHLLQQRGHLLTLCIDEIDVLRPSEVPTHMRIVSLLEGVHHLTPLLLVGQRPLIDGDVLCELTGLDTVAVAEFCAQHNLQPTAPEIQQMVEVTKGNPRLLEFLLTLHTEDTPLKQAVLIFREAPTLEALFERVWRRLSPDEQFLLLSLSVFRRPAPASFWDGEVLGQIRARYLLQEDSAGGVEVLPVFRGVLLKRMLPEERQKIELQAADIRLSYGEYTETAYHLVKAGQADAAVTIWHMHRRHEIEQGQGKAALDLFETLTPAQLNDKTYELLRLVRAELYKLVGDYDLVQRDLNQVSWSQLTFRYQAQRLLGDVADLQDYWDVALRQYDEGLRTVQHLLTQSALFRKSRAWSFLNLNDLDQSVTEVQRAVCEIEYMYGCILLEQGDLSAAWEYGQRVMERATSIQFVETLANVHDLLSEIAEKRGEFAISEEHIDAAEQLYQKTGRASALADLIVNRGNLYNMMQRYNEAILCANQAHERFVRLKSSWGIASAQRCLAEAFLGLQQLDEAERAAQQVLATEDEHTRPDGLRVLAEVALLQGDMESAERFARASIATAEEFTNQYLEGYGYRTLGKVYSAQQQPQNAQQAFRKAATIFNALGLYKEIADTHVLMDTPSSSE